MADNDNDQQRQVDSVGRGNERSECYTGLYTEWYRENCAV